MRRAHTPGAYFFTQPPSGEIRSKVDIIWCIGKLGALRFCIFKAHKGDGIRRSLSWRGETRRRLIKKNVSRNYLPHSQLPATPLSELGKFEIPLAS